MNSSSTICVIGTDQAVAQFSECIVDVHVHVDYCFLFFPRWCKIVTLILKLKFKISQSCHSGLGWMKIDGISTKETGASSSGIYVLHCIVSFYLYRFSLRALSPLKSIIKTFL